MILFQENWKQEVREYLRPFLVTSSPSPEITTKFNINIYKLEILQKKSRLRYPKDDSHWGEFLVGNTKFHHVTALNHDYHFLARITWAKKSDCYSLMCFLAAAVLVRNNFDLTVGHVLVSDREALRIFSHEYQGKREDCPSLILSSEESWFPYTWDINSIAPSHKPKLADFIRLRWGPNGKPLPAVTKAKELRNWQIENDWWIEMVLFETEEHFIWWDWTTTA